MPEASFLLKKFVYHRLYQTTQCSVQTKKSRNNQPPPPTHIYAYVCVVDCFLTFLLVLNIESDKEDGRRTL